MRSLRSLERATVVAEDGDVGGISDFLVDDDHWTVRYVVANTFEFLDGRMLLISPISIRGIDERRRQVSVTTRRDALMKSPRVDLLSPISRREEHALNLMHGFRRYWGRPSLWGKSRRPDPRSASAPVVVEPDTVAHLHLASELRRFDARGRDGKLGQVEDLLIDSASFRLRYLVLEIGSWWSPRRVVIPPQWASSVSWPTREIVFDLESASVRSSPTADLKAPLSRAFEERVYAFHGRAGYWEDAGADEDAQPDARAPLGSSP